MMSQKRPRLSSASSSSISISSASSLASSPVSKIQAADATSEHPLLCTLPPTCNHRPTAIANSRDLEIHYGKYHAHVCEVQGCGCVFPEERLLELHQTECHDPIAALRRDRGEKIYACFVATCTKRFAAPKPRRLHLIQYHGYPDEYFFAVTLKGIGGLLKKWGDGATMLRKPYNKDEAAHQHESQVGTADDEDVDSDSGGAGESTPQQHTVPLASAKPKKYIQVKSAEPSPDPMDDLAEEMTSLSLVPSSIRFGRGGKNGGFDRGRGRGKGANQKNDSMDIDHPSQPTPTARGRGGVIHIPRGRGLGGRGRAGRARVNVRGRGQ